MTDIDRADSRVVVARLRQGLDELAADPLVITLGQVVLNELLHQVAEVALPEDHELIEALGCDRASRIPPQ